MTGLMARAAASPPLNPASPLLRQLDAQIEPLEAELDTLRSNGRGIFKPATDRVRELRRQLATLDKEFKVEFNRLNPEWVRHWVIQP